MLCFEDFCLNLQQNLRKHSKYMNKKILLVSFAVALLSACGNSNDNSISLKLKNDSILEENVNLNTFIDKVAWSMDSLVRGERMLLKTQPEGTPLTPRQQIAANLKVYEEIVNRQRDRIAEMEAELKDSKSAHAKSMATIVNVMKLQLAEKDKEIAMLKEELESKDFSIERLEKIVASLNNDVANLNEKNQAQQEALASQSNKMNEAYVIVGSKKELKAAGVLSSSGLFSKAKLQSADFNASKFTKVDMRKYKTVKINGKNAKVLTPSPSSSYTIADNGDGTSTLSITDPTAFWGVSHYLVVQVK